jgi:uncharacterized protein
MQCPQCPASLQHLTVGLLELDECPRCLGMWFDAGELQALLATAFSTYHLSQRQVPRDGALLASSALSACPRCRRSLTERDDYQGQVFGCDGCEGLWFPAAVLSRLLDLHEAVNQALGEEGPATLAAGTPAVGAASGNETTHPVPAVSRQPSSHATVHSDEEITRPVTAVSRGPTPPWPQEPDDEATRLLPARSRQPRSVEGPCPACGSSLRPRVHQAQRLFVCDDCQGVFFPRRGLPQFLRQGASSWAHVEGTSREPSAGAPCPSCERPLQPIRWQQRPVRVWACEGCWSMFSSARGLLRLTAPDATPEQELPGPALLLWRMVDALTEWLVNPPKRAPSWRFRL